MARLPRPTLKRVNNFLFLIIILLDAYVISAPFIPSVISRPTLRRNLYSVPIKATTPATQNAPIQQSNQLFVPVMQLDQPIHEGRDTYTELDKGVWHWPDSSTPDKGGNTVLLGHRFTYANPRGVFYFLDLVKAGDEISVEWNNVLYTYRVYQTEVVTPDHTEIIDPTSQPTLTIYTCTPTWWPVNRHVVLAHLEKQG